MHGVMVLAHIPNTEEKHVNRVLNCNTAGLLLLLSFIYKAPLSIRNAVHGTDKITIQDSTAQQHPYKALYLGRNSKEARTGEEGLGKGVQNSISYIHEPN